jgi:hypothetical protein
VTTTAEAIAGAACHWLFRTTRLCQATYAYSWRGNGLVEVRDGQQALGLQRVYLSDYACCPSPWDICFCPPEEKAQVALDLGMRPL